MEVQPFVDTLPGPHGQLSHHSKRRKCGFMLALSLPQQNRVLRFPGYSAHVAPVTHCPGTGKLVKAEECPASSNGLARGEEM